MNIENCKEVLAYFCLPHTLSVRDDTKFVRMADGSLREEKGDRRICITANGIEFSEKFPPEKNRVDRPRRWTEIARRESDWYNYLMLHTTGVYVGKPFVYKGVQVVVIEYFESIGAITASFTLLEVVNLEIKGLL